MVLETEASFPYCNWSTKMAGIIWLGSTSVQHIGAKPNLYCEAIELVCGGSPKICVLVERKSQHRVKWEGWQLKPVWISCLYSTSVQ
jgi:hypothetical protein